MKRLFGSLITAQMKRGGDGDPGFVLRNVLIADGLQLENEEAFDLDTPVDGAERAIWVPQHERDAGKWKSNVKLSAPFFTELIEHPIPIDLRAYKALRGSPLAMDIYSWLTYRMSYTDRPTRPIRWESLMGQFGSSFNTENIDQASRDFKKGFLKALKACYSRHLRIFRLASSRQSPGAANQKTKATPKIRCSKFSRPRNSVVCM
jgi:hypothetical protein